MKEFKIRCSAIGQIMKNGRSKTEKLGETTKTYCETWLKEQLYNRKEEFVSKYTMKGQIAEDHSIDFIAEQLNMFMLRKNETHFENEYLTGTPDVITADFLIDVKNSWDIFTFPLFETECPKSDYYWQAQGYMHLTNKTDYKLIYVLSDTPDHLIESEMRKYNYMTGAETTFEEWHARMTYSDIPDRLKIKIFEIKRNDEDIARIVERVKECREYIETLKVKSFNLRNETIEIL